MRNARVGNQHAKRRDPCEKDDSGEVAERMHHVQTDELASDQKANHRGECHAGCCTDDHSGGIPRYQISDNVHRACAERHADTNLARPLRHRERNQSKIPKPASKVAVAPREPTPARTPGGGPTLVLFPNVAVLLLEPDPEMKPGHLFNDVCGISLRPDDQCGAGNVSLSERYIGLGGMGLSIETTIRYNSNNGSLNL